MTVIKGDPPRIDDAGLEVRRASGLVDDAAASVGRALDLLAGSPQITQHLSYGTSGDVAARATATADEMAAIGTGLQAVAERLVAADRAPSLAFDPEDAEVGAFVLGRSDHGDPDRLTDLDAPDAGWGPIYDGSEVEVVTPYGLAVHRTSDDSWFLEQDGEWYWLGAPQTGSGAEGWEVTDVREQVVVIPGNVTPAGRFAAGILFGTGPTPGGPEDYARLDWNGSGVSPSVGDDVNPEMVTDGTLNHPTPPNVDGSDIIVGDRRHFTYDPERPEYGPSERSERIASFVDAGALLAAGLSAAMNDDGNLQGARLIFSTDGEGRQRVVIQGAGIKNVGDAALVGSYSVSRFDEDGRPYADAPVYDDGCERRDGSTTTDGELPR